MPKRHETEYGKDGRPRIWIDRQEVGFSWRRHPAAPPNCERSLDAALHAALDDVDYVESVIMFGGGRPR